MIERDIRISLNKKQGQAELVKTSILGKKGQIGDVMQQCKRIP
jgi:hypothetical protein